MPSQNPLVRLMGHKVRTLHRDKPFHVTKVTGDSVYLIPDDGTGTERSVLIERIDHLAKQGFPRDSLVFQARKIWGTTQNASYLGALAWEVMRPQSTQS